MCLLHQLADLARVDPGRGQRCPLLGLGRGWIEVKMTWGLDFFVGNVSVPLGPGYKLPLYFSLAKVFGKSERTAIQRGAKPGEDMVGFSLTIKR